MMRILSRISLGLCALALAAACALPACAQMSEVKEKPPMYSYVGFWNIPRAQWADMVKADEADLPNLEQGLIRRNHRGLRQRRQPDPSA